MNVFLSWSGPRSREVAEAFYKWLPTVINSVEPFISQRSIEKGVVGQNELSQSLEEINFGIICLTKDNLHADWILYEAGALSKFQKESRVWTFLLDIKPVNISEPLSKFQHTSFEKNEVLQLLKSINKAVSPDKPLKEDLLEDIFNLNWERLKEILSAIQAKEAATPEPVRDISDISMEVLRAVRRQENVIQELIKQTEMIRREEFERMSRDTGVQRDRMVEKIALDRERRYVFVKRMIKKYPILKESFMEYQNLTWVQELRAEDARSIIAEKLLTSEIASQIPKGLLEQFLDSLF